MAAQFNVVAGRGSLAGTRVEFIKPFEPRPLPKLQWGDRIVSEHQMRGGLLSGVYVGGDLVRQDFGVPAKSGRIEMQIPFLTKAMATALDLLKRGPDWVDVTLTDDGLTYGCIFAVGNITPRTGRFNQYTGDLLFLVEEMPT